MGRTKSSSPRRTARSILSLGLALALSLVLFGPAGGASARVSKRSYKLKPGVTLTTKAYSDGPVRMRIITVTDPQKQNASVDVGAASNVFGGYTPTSKIGSNYNALAAVNGDFAKDGYPVHTSAEDGDLRTAGRQTGVAFSLAHDELRAYAQRPGPKGFGRPLEGNGQNFLIDQWNSGEGKGGHIAVWTPVGGNKQKPGPGLCSVRLVPVDGAEGRRRVDDDGVTRTMRVAETWNDPCPDGNPTNFAGLGAIVVGTKRGSTQAANFIKPLKDGDTIDIRWTVGWKKVADVIGGSPQLLTDPDGDGKPRNVAPKGGCALGYFCARNPRTGVGFNKGCATEKTTDTCKIFIVVVDGRRPGWSVGVNLERFANEFKKLGATWAINMDGGGGATMWVKPRGKYCQRRRAGGCLVNRPTDEPERWAISALMVLPGGDAGEPARMVMPTTAESGATLLPPEMLALADQQAMTDPGSTGGLYDAIARGVFGPVPSSVLESDEFRDVLSTYRSAVPVRSPAG
ncbi:MAG: phosphodiester glycosidase family protein [Actinomycetota bacterium]